MHFVITFGFSLTRNAGGNVESTKRVDKAKRRNKGARRRQRNEIGTIPDTTEAKRNVISVAEILAEVHVEYELVPGYSFKFDCCCWDTAAKIYTETGDRCLRIVPSPMEENAFWAVFSVHHLVELNQQQMQRLLDHRITYKMSFGRNNFSERAKRDKVQGFRVDEDESESVGMYEFLEVYPVNDDETQSCLKPATLPEPIIVADQTNVDFTVVTYVDPIPDRVHRYKFRKMTEDRCFPTQPLKSQLFGIPSDLEDKPISNRFEQPRQKKRSKTSKPMSNRREKETVFESIVPVDLIFADMGTITRYDKTPEIPGLLSILTYIQCDDALSSERLRRTLNPLSIKLEKLSNFPHDVAIDDGFRWFCAKILFAGRTIATPYYNIDGTIYFEYIKCLLYDEFKPEELISCLATEFLTVQVIGVRNNEKSAVGDKQSDYTVPKPESSKSSIEQVLLCVSVFDISDLLKGSWEINLTNHLSHPCGEYLVDVNESSAGGGSTTISPLTSNVLTTRQSSLKLKVRLAADLRGIRRKLLRGDHIFNRILLVLNDSKLANDVLNDVTTYNTHLLSTYETSCETTDLQTEEVLKYLLTGVVVDCRDKLYIFLEGLSNGYLLKTWEKTMRLPVNCGYVCYNSDYMFVSRMYGEFLHLGGLIKIRARAKRRQYPRRFVQHLCRELRRDPYVIAESNPKTFLGIRYIGPLTLFPTNNMSNNPTNRRGKGRTKNTT